VEGKKWVKIERWNADGREKSVKYIREIINDELKVVYNLKWYYILVRIIKKN